MMSRITSVLISACLAANPCNTDASTLVTMSVKHECCITVEQLEQGLLYELKPLAGEYIKASRETGICPVFLAAKDALESGWGRYCYAKNNISGFYTEEVFASKAECIAHVSRFLNEHYLTGNGRYYRGGTIADIGSLYCETPEWAVSVAEIMQGIVQRMNAALPPPQNPPPRAEGHPVPRRRVLSDPYPRRRAFEADRAGISTELLTWSSAEGAMQKTLDKPTDICFNTGNQ